MALSCVEVTCISSLVVALLFAFCGYLSPFWQVGTFTQEEDAAQPTASQSVDIRVGLHYACVSKNHGDVQDTYCKPLPVYGTTESATTNWNVSTVRWLMTFHLTGMLVSVGFSLAWPVFNRKRRWVRRAASLFGLLTIALGISGLVIFEVHLTAYQRLFQAQFQEIETPTVLRSGASVYLTTAGLVLFALVGWIELFLRLREFLQVKQQDRERRMLLKDEIKFVYGTAPFFIDATTSQHDDPNRNTIWPRVESCHVDIFKPPRVHDHRDISPKAIKLTPTKV